MEKQILLIALIVFSLGLSKLLLGKTAGAPALVADGLHDLFDVFPLLALFATVRIVRRPPSARFPYGYYKFETLLALAIAISMIWIGGQLLSEGIQEIFSPGEKTSLLGALLAGISGIIFLWLSRYQAGLAEGFLSIEANAKERLLDALASVAVALTLIVQPIVPPLQGIVTVLISLAMVVEGVKYAEESLLTLLDAWTDRKLAVRLSAEISNIPGVVRIEKLRLRKAGPVIFGEIHVVLRAKTAEEVEKILKKISETAKSLGVSDLAINPIFEKEAIVVAIPVKNGKICKHFGRAPEFLIVDFKSGERKVVKNPAARREKLAGFFASKVFENVNTVVALRVGEVAYSALKSRFIKVYQAVSEDIEENLRLLKEGKLKELKPGKPGHRE